MRTVQSNIIKNTKGRAQVEGALHKICVENL